MDKAPAHPSPALRVIAADNDDISRHAQISKGAMEAHRLLGLISNLRLDNEKVDIAVGTGLPASMRAKKNHLGIRSSRRQAAPGLGNQGVVNDLHSPKS